MTLRTVRVLCYLVCKSAWFIINSIFLRLVRGLLENNAIFVRQFVELLPILIIQLFRVHFGLLDFLSDL